MSDRSSYYKLVKHKELIFFGLLKKVGENKNSPFVCPNNVCQFSLINIG